MPKMFRICVQRHAFRISDGLLVVLSLSCQVSAVTVSYLQMDRGCLSTASCLPTIPCTVWNTISKRLKSRKRAKCHLDGLLKNEEAVSVSSLPETRTECLEKARQKAKKCAI